MNDPTAAALLDVPLLAGLSEDFREHLADILEVEEHAVGHVIVREGASGYAFYVIADGTVSVTQEGRELRTMGAGEYFGEISIDRQGRRTATVTAASPVVLWVLFGTDFRVLEDNHPDVASALTAAIEERLATG
jgi:CRP-like cAMP-binding protein